MEVRIGVTYTPKEIEVDLGDDAGRATVQKDIDAVLSGATKVLWLTDRKGRMVAVPGEKIAYVEISGKTDHRVGFVG